MSFRAIAALAGAVVPVPGRGPRVLSCGHSGTHSLVVRQHWDLPEVPVTVSIPEQKLKIWFVGFVLTCCSCESLFAMRIVCSG